MPRSRALNRRTYLTLLFTTSIAFSNMLVGCSARQSRQSCFFAASSADATSSNKSFEKSW